VQRSRVRFQDGYLETPQVDVGGFWLSTSDATSSASVALYAHPYGYLLHTVAVTM
jgi:hypothetical protein